LEKHKALKEAQDCNPSGYHDHPKGYNFVLLLFLRSKNNNKHDQALCA
jgi:hypothetical protein